MLAACHKHGVNKEERRSEPFVLCNGLANGTFVQIDKRGPRFASSPHLVHPTAQRAAVQLALNRSFREVGSRHGLAVETGSREGGGDNEGGGGGEAGAGRDVAGDYDLE